MLGGNTDANAAIVCGLIGCLVGVHKIPHGKLMKLLYFDCSNPINQGPVRRPAFLSTKKFLVSLIEQLLECKPQKGLVVKEEDLDDC